MNQKLVAITMALLGGLFLSLNADARQWTRASDGKKLTATFVSYDGEIIVLKLANGNEVKVQKDLLRL